MNPFTQMATVLTASSVPAWNVADIPEKGLSRTETIRRLLKAANRPVTAAEITFDVEFPNFGSHLVWLLLKHDISKGRVIFKDGRYSWSHEYDSAQATAIRDAIKLLKSNGYQVKPPKDAA